jgi:DHA1 family tetracycline resistance protein-like MFS transporter
MPGIHFLIGAICMLLSLFIIWKVLTKEKKESPELQKAIEEGTVTERPVH